MGDVRVLVGVLGGVWGLEVDLHGDYTRLLGYRTYLYTSTHVLTYVHTHAYAYTRTLTRTLTRIYLYW